MSDSTSRSRRGGNNVLLIALATVGVLTIFTGLLFFGLTAMVVKGLSDAATTTVVEGETEEGVGIVKISGVIADSDAILTQLRKFRDNSRVKAIVIRIDSPGGAVGASQELFQEIKHTDSVKPVVVSMGSVAASGGFYAAMGARTIVANPGTVTGSIGVIMKIPNLQKLMEKVGIGTTVIKSGKLKDLGSVTRPLTPEEKAILEDVMNDIHNQFISDVAKSRNLPEEQVRKIADGRIISGKRALELGLVDKMGNFYTAVLAAAEAGGIKGEPALIYPAKDKVKMIREILENGAAGAVSQGIKRAIQGSGAEYVMYE